MFCTLEGIKLMNDDSNLYQLAEQVGLALCEHRYRITLAESCTGGWIAKIITDTPRSSEWFEYGFVTYANQAKQAMLGVNLKTLDMHGAVSEATVREMAAGALQKSGAEVAIAVSGIAGPGGGAPEKPVGTVWFAWGFKNGQTHTQVQHFAGDRRAVRLQSAKFALEKLLSLLQRDIA